MSENQTTIPWPNGVLTLKETKRRNETTDAQEKLIMASFRAGYTKAKMDVIRHLSRQRGLLDVRQMSILVDQVAALEFKSDA